MVLSSVEQDHCIGFPVSILLAEFIKQPFQEERKDVCIRVHLCEGKVNLTLGVDRSNHTDARSDATKRDGVRLVPRPPLHAPEVCLVEPGLVDVDDARVIAHRLKHELAILLSEYETPLRISLIRNQLDLSIPHPHALPENIGHILSRDLLIIMSCHVIDALLTPPNVLLGVDDLGGSTNNRPQLPGLDLFSLSQSLHKAAVFLIRPHKPGHQCLLHLVF